MKINVYGGRMEDQKALLQSSTFYGVLITVLPFLYQLLKIDLGNPEVLVSAIATVIGAVMTIIGRIKAKKSITSILPKKE